MKKMVYSFLLISQFAWADVGMIADVSLSPAGSFKAKTSEIVGEATMTGDVITADKIVVKLKNMKTGIELRDKHTTTKYLEVEKFPEAVLTSATGSGGKGKGKLKLRGVEKDVEGTYKIVGNELNAEFPIKLSDFNIKGIKYMGVGVNDNLNINITVPLKKK